MNFIIFDIDGTLTNTKQVDDRCFIASFNEVFGIDISEQKWEDLINVTDWGITEEIIVRTWNRKPSKSEYEKLISSFVGRLEIEKEADKSQFKEIVGAKDFFLALKKLDDIEIGIATGGWEKSAILKLNAIDISMHGICFSNSNDHKSRELITLDVIDQLKEKHKTSPDRIIYFGDGAWDYKTCKKLAIDFIGIDVDNNGKLKKIGATTVFSDYLNTEQILPILRS